MTIIATPVIAWYMSVFVEWSLHKLAHWRTNIPGLRGLHTAHLAHHKIHYPVNKLLQPGPYNGGGGSLAFAPFLTGVLIALYFALPTYVFAITLCESLLMIKVSNHLHVQFHIDGSYLERFDWFQHRRRLHFLHHKNPKKNMSLGGLDYACDYLFGTYID
jgi:hypothetical protein